MFLELVSILKYLAISYIVIMVLLLVSIGIVYQNPDMEKNSTYECGFSPKDDARLKFNIKFFLVSILFLVFDIEVLMLFPWAINVYDISWYGNMTMFIFVFVLTLGFVYEWQNEALDW